MFATSYLAEEEQVSLSAALSPLYVTKSTVVFLEEEQSENYLIQMLFVSVFSFLLLVLKVFLFKYAIFVCNCLVSFERPVTGNSVIVLGCLVPGGRYNTVP